MVRRLLVPLALVLVSACAIPSSNTTTVRAAEAALPADEPDVARTSAWLSDMDRGARDFGPGQLEVASLDGGAEFLELASLDIDVETVGAMASYEVTHVFHNHSEAMREGTFRFPLPAGAVVTGLAMEVEGVLMDGEILERERAREIYEEIVDSMRDPALLEWEAGQTFKLRVFPIQPDERKRVVMRYMAPLVPDDSAESGFAVAIPSAAPAMQTALPSLVVNVDGREVLRERDHGVRENVTIALDSAHVPAYVQEQHDGQRYLAVRLDLDWASIPTPAPAAEAQQRRTVIVVDSSRSALESWDLARESVSTVLEGLGPDASFMLIAADLDAWVFGEGFVRNDPATREAALEFLATLEPDGASDLGRAMATVGEALRSPSPNKADLDQVVYVGDGTATWGTTEPGALVEQVEAALGETPLYALSVGKRESRELLETLTGTTGGRTVRPRTVAQVEAFNRFLDRAPAARKLVEVELEVPGVERVHGPLSQTWFEGERPVVHFRLAEDQALPESIVVRGHAAGQPFEQRVALGSPEALVGVRQQWAAREIAVTTDKAAAVSSSIEHSVLSKHTALLVLESEEAYERYKIERRHGPNASTPDQAGDPTISGRDLEGGDASPYLGPGDLQPGDPEVHIPAPRDAVSVEVVFPFGETKAARWEDGLGQWTVRFLVDDDTEPGTYEVLVRITHADGRVELLELDYTIDVEAPQLRLELEARDDGAYDVYAHQILSEADAARERVEGRPGGERAHTLDAKRVELIMPDGQTLSLRRGLPGQFVRRWQPRADVELRWPATVTVVVTDRALNYRRVELPLAGPESGQ